MPDTDDKIVEAMARAVCVSENEDPDEDCMCDSDRYQMNGWLHERWYHHRTMCRRQLAAHRAMIKAEKEQGG